MPILHTEMQSCVTLAISQVYVSTESECEFDDAFIAILSANYEDGVAEAVPGVGVHAHLEDLLQLLEPAESRQGKYVN